MLNNKKILVIFIILLTVIFLSGVISINAADSSSKVITLTAGLITHPDHIQGQALRAFAERIEEKSNGKLKMKIFYNAQLGKGEAIIESLIEGSVDITNEGLGLLSVFHPEYGLLETFYNFRDLDHFRDVVNSGKLEYFNNLALEDPGIRILFYTGGYERNILSTFPINSIEDLKGRTMRSRNVDVSINWWESLGAIPVPITYAEVYTALQTGVAEGTQNTTSAQINQRFVEVAKYLARTQHRIELTGCLMSNRNFESLDPDLQQIMLETAKEVQKEYIEVAILETNEHLKIMQEKFGVTITYPDKKPFIEISRKQLWGLAEEYGILDLAKDIF